MNPKTGAPDAAPPPPQEDESTLPAGTAGAGFSLQKPVVIAATSSHAGVPAEYAWLKRTFGEMGQDWKVDVRSLGRNEQGRTVETFRLTLKGGAKVDVHFDITSFHTL
jgi:hypothetical protein